jgi:hypothetical protein
MSIAHLSVTDPRTPWLFITSLKGQIVGWTIVIAAIIASRLNKRYRRRCPLDHSLRYFRVLQIIRVKDIEPTVLRTSPYSHILEDEDGDVALGIAIKRFITWFRGEVYSTYIFFICQKCGHVRCYKTEDKRFNRITLAWKTVFEHKAFVFRRVLTDGGNGPGRVVWVNDRPDLFSKAGFHDPTQPVQCYAAPEAPLRRQANLPFLETADLPVPPLFPRRTMG